MMAGRWPAIGARWRSLITTIAVLVATLILFFALRLNVLLIRNQAAALEHLRVTVAGDTIFDGSVTAGKTRIRVFLLPQASDYQVEARFGGSRHAVGRFGYLSTVWPSFDTLVIDDATLVFNQQNTLRVPAIGSEDARGS